jgi:hypothetical protein
MDLFAVWLLSQLYITALFPGSVGFGFLFARFFVSGIDFFAIFREAGVLELGLAYKANERTSYEIVRR